MSVNETKKVLHTAVEAYIKHPYRFLRENDLVCHLAHALQEKFDVESWDGVAQNSKLVTYGIIGPEKSKTRKLIPNTETRVRTSRVRTEVKLHPPLNSESNHKRVDLCVLRPDDDIHIYHHGTGVRDVVLKVDSTQVSSLIEVKLYPSTYVRPRSAGKSGHGWLDDLYELHQHLNLDGEEKPLDDEASGHLIFVDTSIPLEANDLGSAGMLYKLAHEEKKPFTVDKLAGKNTLAKLADLISRDARCWSGTEIVSRSGGSQKLAWSLPAADFCLRVEFGKDGAVKRHVHFQLVEKEKELVASSESRLFLHGLGKSNDDGENGQARTLSCCWSVDFESCDGAIHGTQSAQGR